MFNLEKLGKCEKDVQNIDVHSEVKNSVVFNMDGDYTENAEQFSVTLLVIQGKIAPLFVRLLWAKLYKL